MGDSETTLPIPLMARFGGSFLVVLFALSGPWTVPDRAIAEVWAGVGQKNLIVNGDLEVAEVSKPPSGWVMWGAQQFKKPENYQRDLKVFHSGQASLRIFHPKDTAGYIVTDPQLAIRPEPGMAYQIRFFARADKPCQGRFMVLAYHSIRPFVDAETPLSTAISLDTEWREYRFEIRESIDFFADSARYIMLGFQASGDPRTECTMWLDDVVVTAHQMESAARLINPATLKITPVPHRLKPGVQLDVETDISNCAQQALKAACGISFHRLVGFTGYPFDAGGQYLLPAELEEAIRQLRLPMSRVYGVGHEPPRADQPAWPIETAIDRLAQLCDRIGLSRDMMVVELEEQSANRKLDAEIWARAVQYSRSKGYGFRFWEVANEPYSQTFGSGQSMGRAFPTSDDYIDHVKSVATAIRRIDPEAQVGIAIAIARPLWGNYVLKNAAGYYDFVVAHYYGFENAYRNSFEELVLGQNYRVLEQIQRTQSLIEAYNAGRKVYQLDTEWGMHSSGPNGERADYADRNANIIGVCHRAVRLIYYVREQPLAGASAWQMLGHSRGLGFTILAADQPNSRTMLYWLYFYFSRHIGEKLIDFEGTAPFYTTRSIKSDTVTEGPVTPVLLTADAEQRSVFCVVANGSWSKDVPCRLVLKNFQGRLATATLLSGDDLDGSPLLVTKDPFVRSFSVDVRVNALERTTLVTGTLPAHSVVFVTLERLP